MYIYSMKAIGVLGRTYSILHIVDSSGINHLIYKYVYCIYTQ